MDSSTGDLQVTKRKAKPKRDFERQASDFVALHRPLLEDPRLDFLALSKVMELASERVGQASDAVTEAHGSPAFSAHDLHDRQLAYDLLLGFYRDAEKIRLARFDERGRRLNGVEGFLRRVGLGRRGVA